MKQLILTIAALLCLGKAWGQPAAQPLPFDPEVTTGVLPNGMTYYIQHNENPKERAYFYIAQKVGSVQEEENQRGLAHFLEHMCFNGSEHFKGNGVIEFCQRIGVQFGRDLNAYTAADRTVYNINNVPTTQESNLDSCLYILYDWANGLTLDPAEIDKERGVIHEEWRMRSGAFMRILERQLPTLIPGSRYGERLPIGLMSVVDNFEPQALRDYYEKWYRPDLQGIIIVGDIDVKAMEKKVKKLFASIEMPANPAPFEYFPVPENSAPIVVMDKDKEVTSPVVMFNIKYEPLPREMRQTIAALPVEFLTSMVEKMFSYRFEDLKQNPDAPFTSLEVGEEEFILASTMKAFTFEFVPKDDKSIEAMTEVTREIVRAGRFGFQQPEYERAVTDFLSALDQAKEARKTIKSVQLVQECVDHFLENKLKTSFEAKYQIYQQLAKSFPLETVNEFVDQLIGDVDTNVVVLGLYPDREGFTVPTSEEMASIIETVKAEDIQPYEVKTVDTRLLDFEPHAGKIKKELPADNLGYKGLLLSNGVKVLYKQTDFDKGNVLFTAVSKGGSGKYPLSQIDNIELFNQVMQSNGLGKFNYNDLQKALTGRQVKLTPSLTPLSERLSGRTAPKDMRYLMQLIYLTFTDLNYDTLSYHNTLTQVQQYLANRDANPINAFQDSITTFLYAHNPRHMPMSLERLQNVSYDGIYQIAKERFANAADFTFVFTGNLDEDSLRIFACQYLASLPAKGALEKKLGDDGARYWKGEQTCQVKKKMETPQGYLLQVWNGDIPYSVKNEAVADAAGRVLSSIYLETVREQYSFAYSVQSTGQLSDRPQTLFILQTVCPVKPEKCDSALLLINEGIQKIAAQGIDNEHLSKVKEQMLTQYENNLRENRYWQELAAAKVYHNRDEFTGSKEAIEDITSEDIQQFIRDYMLKQNNSLVVTLLPEEP